MLPDALSKSYNISPKIMTVKLNNFEFNADDVICIFSGFLVTSRWHTPVDDWSFDVHVRPKVQSNSQVVLRRLAAQVLML